MFLRSFVFLVYVFLSLSPIYVSYESPSCPLCMFSGLCLSPFVSQWSVCVSFPSLSLSMSQSCLCVLSLSVPMFPSLCFLSLQSGVDSRSPFLVSSSYILVMVSVLLPVFVFLQSRPAFSVFSFTSPVSSCLIHSCCVPNMFPLTVSFLMCIYCVSFPFSLVYMSPCLKCLGISRCSKFNEFTFPSLGFCDYFLFSWFSCLFNIF